MNYLNMKRSRAKHLSVSQVSSVILNESEPATAQHPNASSYQSGRVRERRVQFDGAARRADGQPGSDGGGGDGAGGGHGRCGGAGDTQRLLAAEQRLTQGRETFLWRHNTTP